MRNVYKFYLILITIIVMILSCTPATAIPTPTATAYIPVSQNTPLPLVYEAITPENSHLLTLLTRREFNTLVARNLGFTSKQDMLCIGNYEVAEILDLFESGDNPDLKDCHLQFSNDIFGRAISPDGRFIAEISWGDLLTGRRLSPITELSYKLKDAISVRFSSSGAYIAIGFQDGQVWFVPRSKWDLDNETFDFDPDLRPELTIDVKKAPLQIFFSPDDTLIAFLFEDQTIQLWNTSNLSLSSTIDVGTYPTPVVTKPPFEDEVSREQSLNQIYKIAFSHDNQILITVSADNQIRLWDVRAGKFLVALEGCQDNTEVNSLVFSPTKRLLASMSNRSLGSVPRGSWVCVWGILPDNLDKAKPSATAISESVFPIVSPVSSFPTPAPTPTASPTLALSDNQTQALLNWPVSTPTSIQITEARECSIETLARSRYPEGMNYWELEDAYPLNSACDWAVLAIAYRAHYEDKDSIPEEGKRAFFESVRKNPALAMSPSLFYFYFDSLKLVEAPPQLNQTIKSIIIDYSWYGIGEPSQVNYHIEIDNAHLPSDQLRLAINSQPENLRDNLVASVNPEKIQGVGKALTDFLPVTSPFTLENCTDNSPDWNINLTLLDGTELELKTHNSNFFTVGGPWHMELDGQNYVQFSSTLVDAMLDLFNSMNLPLGQPYGMFCSQVDVFELAYP